MLTVPSIEVTFAANVVIYHGEPHARALVCVCVCVCVFLCWRFAVALTHATLPEALGMRDMFHYTHSQVLSSLHQKEMLCVPSFPVASLICTAKVAMLPRRVVALSSVYLTAAVCQQSAKVVRWDMYHVRVPWGTKTHDLFPHGIRLVIRELWMIRRFVLRSVPNRLQCLHAFFRDCRFRRDHPLSRMDANVLRVLCAFIVRCLVLLDMGVSHWM